MYARSFKKNNGNLWIERVPIALFLAAQGSGGKKISDLARVTGIARTAIYPPLKMLVNEGLVSVVKIGKRRAYRSVPIRDLEALLDRKKIQLHDVLAMLPKSLSLETKGLDIRVFEGLKGLLTASDLFLSESTGSQWKSFEQPDLIFKALDLNLELIKAYTKRRIEKGIHIRGIIPANSQSTTVKEMLAQNKENLREAIIVSPNLYPIDASLAISDDMIQLISTTPTVFSVLIKNAALATTLSSIHDMVWHRFSR